MNKYLTQRIKTCCFWYFGSFVILFAVSSCKTKNQPSTYGETRDYFNKKTIPIELKACNGTAKLLVLPEYQGRIAASSSLGDGASPSGWVNFSALNREEKLNGSEIHGEERVWIGPQGGQFSFYYGLDRPLDESKWEVPASFNAEPFDLYGQSQREVDLSKNVVLTNNFGTTLHMTLYRNVRILEKQEIEGLLSIQIPGRISFIGYQTAHRLQNTDSVQWKKDSGLASIWSLSTFKGTDRSVTFIPIKGHSGKPVFQYMGKPGNDRFVVHDNVVWYRTDGKFRSKIGIPPNLSKGLFGNYQPEINMLRIIQFQQSGDSLYFNSNVFEQRNPYDGEAIAVYNNGPMNLSVGKENSFFELESASPQKELLPGESVSHFHRVFQFIGEKAELDRISQEVLGISLADIPVE